MPTGARRALGLGFYAFKWASEFTAELKEAIRSQLSQETVESLERLEALGEEIEELEDHLEGVVQQLEKLAEEYGGVPKWVKEINERGRELLEKKAELEQKLDEKILSVLPDDVVIEKCL